ncbi:MAG: hypothetical protein EAY68_11205, partial [Bacteroidetes bacterium]
DFVQYYFKLPDTTLAPFAWFHKEAIENVFIKKKRKHIWRLHREAAKSVFADIFIPIFKLVNGDLTGMILASENADKAKNLIKDVEAQLRHNQKLIHDFGDFGINGSWLQGFFQTESGIGFWSFGLGQNPAGVRNGFLRPNLGIVDDADNKDLAKNQKLTKEKVDWIKGEFMGCLAKDDRTFIYTNNKVHKQGITAHLLGDLEEGDPIDESYATITAYLTENPITHEPIFPIDTRDETEQLDYFIKAGAAPAWKEYYSLQDCVNKIIDYGYRNAMRQLYHTHIEDGNRFTDNNMPWVECHQLHEYEALVTYCDPAFGESDKGCYRSIVLLGIKNRNYDILWVWIRQKGNFASAHREIATKIREGAPIYETETAKFRQKINCQHWIESNELQKILLKKIYEEENAKHDLPWEPRYDMESKADKIGRIESLETLADNGHLRFNVALKKDKDMLVLRDQFKGFPDGFIDGPDSVEGAISKLIIKKRASENKMRVGKYKKSNARMG